MTGAAQSALMKPIAYLANAARAALVEKDALHEALKNGTMAGAALDDLHREPLPRSSPSLDCPSVLATPHIEGSSVESIPRPSAGTVASILTRMRGERPRLVFSPQVDEPVAGGR
jgi:D-3-phosphoglycerate dehydrogenase